jgi:hypothetical protein
MKILLYYINGDIYIADLKDKKDCMDLALKVDNYHRSGLSWYIETRYGRGLYNWTEYKGIPDFIQFIKGLV